MALMTWTSQYSVGVSTMDDQHGVLFRILNELHDAMKQGHAQTVTGPLLRNLADYTRRHFASEEALMTNAAFPGLAAHRAKHKELIKQVDTFAARFERGDTMLSIDLLNFLRDWLTTHIQKEDKQYGPWLSHHAAH